MEPVWVIQKTYQMGYRQFIALSLKKKWYIIPWCHKFKIWNCFSFFICYLPTSSINLNHRALVKTFILFYTLSFHFIYSCIYATPFPHRLYRQVDLLEQRPRLRMDKCPCVSGCPVALGLQPCRLCVGCVELAGPAPLWVPAATTELVRVVLQAARGLLFL